MPPKKSAAAKDHGDGRNGTQEPLGNKEPVEERQEEKKTRKAEKSAQEPRSKKVKLVKKAAETGAKRKSAKVFHYPVQK